MAKVKKKETKRSSPTAKSGRAPRSLSVKASDDELSYLRELANSNPQFERRVQVILASVAGEPIHEIVKETGLSRCSVWIWRRRFRDYGVAGLAPKVILTMSEFHRRLVEKLQASDNAKVAGRAKLLLEIMRTADVAAAARNAGVSLQTAYTWRRDFERRGIDSLSGPRVGGASTGLRELTSEERARLVGWSTVESNISTKAAAILALADGEKSASIAARMGVAKSTIETWRRRFLVLGLSAINGRSLALNAKQHAGLERLERFAPPEVAKRATVLLNLARTGNVLETARNASICPKTVTRLRGIYERRGEAGLTQPKAASGREMRRFEVKPSFNAELQLRAEFRLVGSGKPLIFRGQTRTISSRFITCVADERQTVSGDFGGCLVAGEIDWPVTRENGEPVKLSVEGRVVETGPERFRVKLRYGLLRAASETGMPEGEGSTASEECERDRIAG